MRIELGSIDARAEDHGARVALDQRGDDAAGGKSLVEERDPARDRGVPADKIFSTLAEALDKVQADFLVDVTPPAVHHEVAAKAFAKGLHVLGEKPLSDNFENARKVVEQGKAAGVKHMITQNYRFTEQPRTTRPLIESGLIGQPGQCDIQFYIPWADYPGTHYVTEPFMLINDMMVHHFDMRRYVLGQDP